MGKAVPTALKKRAEFLMEKFPDKFTPDFEKNKKILNEFNLPLSTKQRNLIAGYTTRKMVAKSKA